MEAQIAQLKLAQRTNQLVIVIAEAVEAEVSFWEKQDAKWRMKLQTKGYVGEAGIGNAREGSKVTPEGAFRLGQAFGKKDPGSKTAFRPITASDYWISNPESAYYNTWQQFQTSEMDESLYAYSEHQYEFARLIHYNTDPIIKGAGSAFFLHVENQRPTAGCVAVPREDMIKLIQATGEQAYIIHVKSKDVLHNY
ncbi:L,D-transpeptidase family protein [Listeria grayi]|uniref:L,D-transpeptidase family protein n=1 Tax=Listeria grayi TaxID=1641 RepID=UPI001626E5B0|nr:L,D-transpeptidase family protein [Listeria grayi]MBC1921214.1 L,D-transpeptidase family protein [Listeria grayi]